MIVYIVVEIDIINPKYIHSLLNVFLDIEEAKNEVEQLSSDRLTRFGYKIIESDVIE